MITEPELVELDQTAAAQSLGFTTAPVAWWQVLAASQAALAQAHISLREHDAASVRPLLISAARMLDAASRQTSDLPADDRANIALLAMLAFAIDGNAPSALAIRERFPDLLSARTPNEMVAIAIALPSRIGEVLRELTEPGPQRTYIERLNFYLDNGADDGLPVLHDSLRELIVAAPTSFESVLLASALDALGALADYSVARRLLRNAGPLMSQYLGSVIRDGLRTLLPAQAEAIGSADLFGDAHAVVTMPTSTGKTLLAELVLIASLEPGPGLVCYIAPYVALGRQVTSILRRRGRGLARIHPMIGGYRLPRPLDPTVHREIAICTPERFDALLRGAPDLVEHLRVVVFDEAHLVGNGSRGARLEGIISRLLLRRAQSPRIVLLSAVIPNPENLVSWLGASRTHAAGSEWRPTVRRTVFWGADGRLSLLVGDDRMRRPDQSAASVIGVQPLPWPRSGFYSTSNVGQQIAQAPASYENVAYLGRFLLARREGSVLVVCASRKGTRAVVKAAIDQMAVLDAVPPRIGRLLDRIQRRYPYLRSLAKAAERGVAYHNAALGHDLRELIEDAVRAGEICLVAATTTLAEGVDLPFRFTVLADWLVAADDGQRPMDPLLFRNIAGRSGRAGAHTEGVTVVYDNVVGDPSLVAPQRRLALQSRIFATDVLPPLVSTSTLVDGDGQVSVTHEAVVAANFLAAIPENPQEQELETALYAASFAAVTSLPNRLMDELRDARMAVLDEADGALAVALSPLSLTQQGKAANLTGLSPATCKAVIRMLAHTDLPETEAERAAYVLTYLRTAPEQTNRKLEKKLGGANNRYLVERGDLASSLASWMSGAELEEIFAGLAFVRRSTRSPAVNAWLAGEADSPTWPDVFDQFIDFMSSTMTGFLPWVLRACEALDEARSSVGWALLADYVETGTNNVWASAAVREGAPASRRTLIAIGAAMELIGLSLEDPLGLRLLRTTPEAVRQAFKAALSAASVRGTDHDPEEWEAVSQWMANLIVEE